LRARTSLVLAALLALPACKARADIVVGVAAPLTGRLAEQGRSIENGVADAVAQINAQNGGLLGETLRVIAIDDGCEAKAGAEAARKLVASKVAVVVGHPCASAALAAAPIYAQAGTILFGLTRHPDLTDKRAGPTIFRMAGRDDRQAEAIAEYLLKSARNKRIALVHDRTQYARTLVERVYKTLGPAGITPVLMETIVASGKDYKALASRIKQSAADVLVFGGYPPEAILIMSHLKDIGATPVLVGGDSLAEPAMSGRLAALFPRRSDLSDQPSRPAGGTGDPNAVLARRAIDLWALHAKSAHGVSAAHLVPVLSEPPPGPVMPVLAPQIPAARSTATGANAASSPPFHTNGDAALSSFIVTKAVDGRLSPAD
jgi:branched-chain amino acid transport system substrate-binding protein